MNKTQSWKERISEKLPMLVLAFCLLQPLLDVAGFWQDQLHIGNTVTMALRMLLLAGSVLLGFLLSDRKRYYYIAAAVLLVLTGGHILACMQNAKGYREPVNDLINLVRIYFLPMMTLCFITFLRRNEKVFPAMQKGMLASLLEIALVQLLSTVTGTDPHTYAVDGIGILGWFMWTNSQSAILAMVAPISICWAIRLLNEKPLSGGAKWRYLQIALITAVAEATLFVLAPRLSYFSLLFCGFGVCTCLLITDRKQWKMALAIFLVTALFTAAYPLSPTYRRMTKNEIRVSATQKQIREDLDSLPTFPPETIETETPTDETGEIEPEDPRTEEIERLRRIGLEKIYRRQAIIWSMVQRFGFDRVYEVYDRTADASILSNTRTMKINFCKLLMEESGTLSHLFGLNLKEMTHDRLDANGLPVTDNYDVENDFHGIYFLTGLVGLGLMLLFLLWFGLRALSAILRDPKRNVNLTMAAFLMAYAIGIAHAYFTASVLRRNNASVYLAMVLAGLWFLSVVPKAGKRPETGASAKTEE